jgi:hypothetical protein
MYDSDWSQQRNETPLDLAHIPPGGRRDWLFVTVR